MHESCKLFCEDVRRKYPNHFNTGKILDIGSLNINGNNRYLFTGSSTYQGLDLAPGDNVDLVGVFHEYPFAANTFDTIITTSMLEHDLFWVHSLKKMVTVLKPGGLLLLTCGAPGFPEHGTTKTDTSCSPFTTKSQIIEWRSYYKNLDVPDVSPILSPDLFTDYFLEVGKSKPPDLLFYGIRK